MPDLTKAAITANGYYSFPVEAGAEYLAVFDGTFGAATLTLAFYHPASGTKIPVANLSLTSASPEGDLEPSFIAIGTSMEWIVSGADGSTSLYISVIPIKR